MKKQDYISLDLAKHLHDVGFEEESECKQVPPCPKCGLDDSNIGGNILESTRGTRYCKKCEIWLPEYYNYYSYYQIITELAEKLFGKEEENRNYVDKWQEQIIYKRYTHTILSMLQQKEPQEEIDKYIKNNLIDKWK